MNEPRPKRTGQPIVTPKHRPASGERPATRAIPVPAPGSVPRPGPPPPPSRVSPIKPEQPVAQKPAPPRTEPSAAIDERPPAVPEYEFSPQESPTVSLSKPILKLLAQETTPLEPELSVTLPDPKPEPEPAAAVIVQISPAEEALASERNCDTRPPARPRKTDLTPKLEQRRAPTRPLVWVSAFLVGGALFGVSSWIALRKAQLPAPAVAAPTPAAPLSAALTPTRTPTPTPTLAVPPTPTPAAPTAAAPSSASTSAPAADALSKNAPVKVETSPIATLLAVDGSEAIAPTCDALLAEVAPISRNVAASNRLAEARRALVRGDVDGSERAFCQIVSSGSAEPLVLSELAQLLLLRRDANAAVEWAQQAARRDPSVRNLALLADALVRTGNVDGARAAWLAGAKIAKDDRAAIDKMLATTMAEARASLQHRDAARAERLLRRVLAFDPENVTARAQIAIALTRLGFSKSAERWSHADAAPKR